MVASTSYGIRDQSAVMASSDDTGRNTIGELGAFVTLHAHGMHVGKQHDRALPDVAVEAGLGKLLTCDGISFAQQVKTFLGDFADDADAETGPGMADARQSHPADRVRCQWRAPHP